MKKIRATVCILVALAALVAGCSSAATPAPAATPSSGAAAPGRPQPSVPSATIAPAISQPTAAPSRPLEAAAAGWQQQWDNIVAAAKKEGTVNLYTGGINPEVVPIIAKGLKDKYGITVVQTGTGNGVATAARLGHEWQAGMRLADMGLTIGAPQYYSTFKPLKMVDPIEPLLILPEVKDPGQFRGGEFPFLNDQKQAAAIVMSVTGVMFANTDMVKVADIRSLRDLLDPKWQGKLTMMDPSIGGASNVWYATVLRNMGIDAGRKFMKEFSKNVAFITRDYRQVAEVVAREKYGIAVGVRSEEASQFIALGSHLQFVDTPEPRGMSPNWGDLYVFKERPNPAAAQVLLNWLFTKEAQTLLSALHAPMTRSDVSTEGVPPIAIPRPGDTLEKTEEEINQRAEMSKWAKEDFSRLLQ